MDNKWAHIIFFFFFNLQESGVILPILDLLPIRVTELSRVLHWGRYFMKITRDTRKFHFAKYYLKKRGGGVKMKKGLGGWVRGGGSQSHLRPVGSFFL